MDRLDFIGGAYSARSTIANAQRCVNYYPERNRKDAPAGVTLYQRAGLRPVAQGPAGPVRALYRPSNGVGGYAVINQTLYYIGTDWSLTALGALAAGRTNICSLIDNGTTGLVVDGSVSTPAAGGWTFNLATHAFAQVNDTTGTFQGADRVDILDTYTVWNMKNTTRSFGSTLSGSITFDALYLASKSAYPDPLRSLIVNRREILLLGDLKSEIWYDAGNTNLPFAELPGAYIEHGLAALYSVATSDISVFWLAQDLQGQGMVLRQRGYQTTRISNHALENTLLGIVEAGGIISDAIAYSYQQGGHIFYVLTLPSADQTWVYDDAIGEPDEAWHQEAWCDPDSGALGRHRGNCGAFINGTFVVGDWENGAIYALDRNQYFDTVAGRQCPLVCIRGFPHVMFGRTAQGQPVPSNGLPVQHNEFWLNLEAGTDPTQDVGAQLSLAFSDDRGKTFTTGPMVSAGQLGQYKTIPRWPGIGMAVDRVYEISHSIPGPVALNGAWVRGRITMENLA